MNRQDTGLSREDIQRYEQGGECTVPEAAAILGRHRMTIHRLIERGELYAWSTPGGKKRSLWKTQVKEMKAREQALAIKRATRRQQAVQLSFFHSL